MPCNFSVRAAGFELCAESVNTLLKNSWTEVKCGMGIIMLKACLAFGAKTFAFVDVIDSDFADEIEVIRRNIGNSTFIIG